MSWTAWFIRLMLMQHIIVRRGPPYIPAYTPGSFQFEHPSLRGSYESARDQEQSVPYGLNRLLYLSLMQHIFLKEVHEVVGEHQKLEPATVFSIGVRD